jgi:hypothetical protein
MNTMLLGLVPALLELLCDRCLFDPLRLAPLRGYEFYPKLNIDDPFDFCWLAVVVMFPALAC